MTKFHKKLIRSRGIVLFGLLLFLIAGTGCGKETASFSFSEEELLLAEPEERTMAVVMESSAEETALHSAPEEERVSCLVVHICGAVKRPGVYELPEGSRVMDAVTAGGGFLGEADQDGCNLAAPVTDGCRIYIMTEEESALAESKAAQAGIQPDDGTLFTGQADNAAGDTQAGASADGRVNLNTADAAQLQTLPGIGESRAAAILAWRSEHGRFEKIEDIMKVSGIKQAAFDKLKEYITVN